MGGDNKTNLGDTLDRLIHATSTQEKAIHTLHEQAIYLKNDGEKHIQKIGIVRFNPFSDTGGSQSFTIALLDGKKSGIVITSLYARTGNRWYIKHIHEGVCRDVDLSKEEQTALTKAE